MKPYVLNKVTLYTAGAFVGKVQREELFGSNNRECIESVISFYKTHCMITSEKEVYLELIHQTDGIVDDLKEYHLESFKGDR